jgi:CheY-like chemotaxis protein
MPKKNGFEALSFIKSDMHLKLIPCLLLSTSRSNDDIQKAYALGANSFLCKPFDFNSMVKLFQSINTFWIESADLPQIR